MARRFKFQMRVVLLPFVQQSVTVTNWTCLTDEGPEVKIELTKRMFCQHLEKRQVEGCKKEEERYGLLPNCCKTVYFHVVFYGQIHCVKVLSKNMIRANWCWNFNSLRAAAVATRVEEGVRFGRGTFVAEESDIRRVDTISTQFGAHVPDRHTW